jgi:hypothetical protein
MTLQASFVEAADIKTGDELQTASGTAVVLAKHTYHATAVTYDLTINGLHTYYVMAGTTPVLVHNCTTDGVPHDGGTYGPMKPSMDGHQINHMPQKAATEGYVKEYSGPAIRMRTEDHREVNSTGRSRAARQWLADQRGLVQSGRIDEAMQNDIDDVVSRFPGEYDNAIGEMIGDLPNNAQYQAARGVKGSVHVQLTLW